MRDDGEPISRGRLNRSAAEARALRRVLYFVALIAAAALVNGILAILLIGLLQALGLWDVSASEGAQTAAGDLCDRMRLRAGLAT